MQRKISSRHCEERSDEAISSSFAGRIESIRLKFMIFEEIVVGVNGSSRWSLVFCI